MLRSKFGFVKVGEWKSYEMFSDLAVFRVAQFERLTRPSPSVDRSEPTSGGRADADGTLFASTSEFAWRDGMATSSTPRRNIKPN